MSKSDYLENELLDHVFGAATYTPPATLYVALYTAAPDDAGAGGTEVSGTGYARVAVTNNLTNWPAAVNSQKGNGTEISFGTVGAGGWGQITHFGVYDAASGGNFLGAGELDTPITANEGDTVRFQAGALAITES